MRYGNQGIAARPAQLHAAPGDYTRGTRRPWTFPVSLTVWYSSAHALRTCRTSSPSSSSSPSERSIQVAVVASASDPSGRTTTTPFTDPRSRTLNAEPTTSTIACDLETDFCASPTEIPRDTPYAWGSGARPMTALVFTECCVPSGRTMLHDAGRRGAAIRVASTSSGSSSSATENGTPVAGGDGDVGCAGAGSGIGEDTGAGGSTGGGGTGDDTIGIGAGPVLVAATSGTPGGGLMNPGGAICSACGIFVPHSPQNSASELVRFPHPVQVVTTRPHDERPTRTADRRFRARGRHRWERVSTRLGDSRTRHRRR